MGHRLFVRITREILPQVKDRYPFIYLEHGRMEVDDSSIKWIDKDCNVVRLPIATISTVLLGPGTSITHEAIKVLGNSNCLVCWVGEDSLRFYCVGISPTHDSRNFYRQMRLASNRKTSLEIARRMFAKRFPKAELCGKTLSQMKGMEGYRVKELYAEMARKYKVGWKGRSYIPGKIELSDTTNQYLTLANSMLYALILSVVWSMGYSPYIGFIHSGSPLPFVYDLSDLYKDYFTIDLSFYLTKECYGEMDKERLIEEFRIRVLNERLLERIVDDITTLMIEE